MELYLSGPVPAPDVLSAVDSGSKPVADLCRAASPAASASNSGTCKCLPKILKPCTFADYIT